MDDIGDKTFRESFGDCECYIGDRQSKSDFYAHLEFTPWGEDRITIADPGSKGLATVDRGIVCLDGAVKSQRWKKDGKLLRWEFELKGKPVSNVYSLELGGNWKDFDFHPQTPFPNPTQIMRDGQEWLEWIDSRGLINDRPRALDGSIAVYSKWKHNNKHRFGKAFQILVPMITDALGKTTWAEKIEQVGGSIQVTLPTDFLNQARYPIRINDTFGDTSSATGSNFAVDALVGWLGTPAEDGNATALWAYVGYDPYHKPCTMGLYDSGKNEIVCSAEVDPAPLADAEFTIASTPITNPTEYWIVIHCSDDYVRLYYDAVGGQGFGDNDYSYSAGNMPDLIENVDVEPYHRSYALWCVYTPSGGGNAPTGHLQGPFAGPLGGPI